MKFYVGCPEWMQIRRPEQQMRLYMKEKAKQLYPLPEDAENCLFYYCQLFNFLEVSLFSNSEFDSDIKTLQDLSQIPPFKKWNRITPSDFKCSILIPLRPICNKNDNDTLERFLQEISSFHEKILLLVLKVPSYLTQSKHRDWLDSILYKCCTKYEYQVAAEFENPSWYQDLTYNILKKYNASLIWSDRRGYPVLTSNFVYLRINENLEKWAEKIMEKAFEEEITAIKNTNKHSRNNLNLNFAVVIASTNNIEKLNLMLPVLGFKQIRKTMHNIRSVNNDGVTRKKWIGRAIFHIDINSFYSSCEEIKDPSLKGKPHAVIMTNEENINITRGVVATCSYEAKRLGIQSAMSLYKAIELCPDLILRAVDRKYYSIISNSIMDILEKYADTFEQASIDEAYLDCTNKISSLDITVESYAKEIKMEIKEKCHGLSTSIGVSTSKSVAKIASDYQKPDGLIIVHKDEVTIFLNPLEVKRISGIGKKTQKILHKEMKINTIGQLAKIDVQILIQRFGKKIGTWMWQVSNGIENEPVIPRGDHISLSSESTLESFTRDRQEIEKLLNELVDELYGRITNNGYQFRTVGIKLVRTDFSIETREISYPNYQNDRKSIESVIEELLHRFNLANESINHIKGKSTEKILAVSKIGLKVSNLFRYENKNFQIKQKTIFDYIN